MQTSIFKYHKKDPDNDETIIEDVTPERWVWEAHYDDGSLLAQFDTNTGLFHRFSEIDQSKLHHFCMVNFHDPAKQHTIFFNKDRMKLVHYYKQFKLQAGTKSEQRLTIYCFGIEVKMGGFSQKYISMIMPDDNIITTENPNEIQITLQ